MADELNEQVDIDQGFDQIDSWQAAFDAINKEKEDNSEAAEQSEGSQDIRNDPQDDDGSEDPNADGTGNSGDSLGNLGGSGDLGGASGESNVFVDGDDYSISEADIEQINNDLVNQAKDAAVRDVAQAFIKRGIRHKNGKLGATIDDPDICKRDEDGVPVFYNPDTGREFTGDNPRRQAKEWVEDYNNELAVAFNQACQKYVDKFLETEKPRLEVLQFAPTYEKLDPVRRKMFDSIIEDYEVKDNNGTLVGYSCDLNKMLAAVNRQVAMVQEHAKSLSKDSDKPKSKGPALDIKSSNAAVPKEKPEFKSLAEAMEWQQDQMIANNKKN